MYSQGIRATCQQAQAPDQVNIPFVFQQAQCSNKQATARHRLIVLLDTSRSMELENRIVCAKQVLKQVFASNMHEASLIAFDKTAKRIISPFLQNSATSIQQAQSLFASVFATQKNVHQDLIDAIEAYGEATNYDIAFQMAFEEIKLYGYAPNTITAILLITDGEPNDGTLRLEKQKLVFPENYWEQLQAKVEQYHVDFISCIGIGKHVSTQPLNALCQALPKSMMHLITNPSDIAEAIAPTMSAILGASILRTSYELKLEPHVLHACIWEMDAKEPFHDEHGNMVLKYTSGLLGNGCTQSIHGSFAICRQALPTLENQAPVFIGSLAIKSQFCDGSITESLVPITIDCSEQTIADPLVFHQAEYGKARLDIQRAKREIFSKSDASRFVEAHRLVEERKAKLAVYASQFPLAVPVLQSAATELELLSKQACLQTEQGIPQDQSWFDATMATAIKLTMDKAVKDVLCKLQAPKPITMGFQQTTVYFDMGTSEAKTQHLRQYLSKGCPYQLEGVTNSLFASTTSFDLQQMIPNMEERLCIYMSMKPFPFRDEQAARQVLNKRLDDVTLMEWYTVFYSSYVQFKPKDCTVHQDLVTFFGTFAPLELLIVQLIHKRNPSATVINVMQGAYGQVLTMCMQCLKNRCSDMLPSLQPYMVKNNWRLKSDQLLVYSGTSLPLTIR